MQQRNETQLSFSQKANLGFGALEIASSAALVLLRWPGSCGDRFWTGMRSLGVFAPYALGKPHLSRDVMLPDDETSASSSWRSDHEATPARGCGVGGPDR
jgi:hypothetical protein